MAPLTWIRSIFLKGIMVHKFSMCAFVGKQFPAIRALCKEKQSSSSKRKVSLFLSVLFLGAQCFLVTFCRSVCVWLVAGWFSFLLSPVMRLEDYGKLQPCPQVPANVPSCLKSAVSFLFWSAYAQNEITQKHLLWWCWIMITLFLPGLDLYTASADKLIKTLETHY